MLLVGFVFTMCGIENKNVPIHFFIQTWNTIGVIHKSYLRDDCTEYIQPFTFAVQLEHLKSVLYRSSLESYSLHREFHNKRAIK